MTLKDKKIYIETYGCQMNVSDSEIVCGIMTDAGCQIAEKIEDADIILLNTCSVREKAEDTVFKRLVVLEGKYQKRKKNKILVGVIGCMAERLHEKLINLKSIVSIVIGPDEYRRLPELAVQAMQGTKGVAVELSTVETYDDIIPIRTEGVSSWLSIMRGCNNFCSYCVVPYTRGRERSRPFSSIISEVSAMFDRGFKEITLLGQNVNSYKDDATGYKFPELLRECAKAVPDMRIRYTTSHPRDMSHELIETMAEFDNICKHIHLPVQSGSNHVLKTMNRRYTVEHYLGRIEKIKSILPQAALSTDIIAGYPTESEEDHKQTLDLMRIVKYSGAYMFKYSPREGTKAFDLNDPVSEEIKSRRLSEIIDLQSEISITLNEAEWGREHIVLADGPSKRNPKEWMGRSDTNKTVIFPNPEGRYKSGDFVKVVIKGSTSATLTADVV